MPKLHFQTCFSEARALAGVGTELAQARLLAWALFLPGSHSQLSRSGEDEVEAAAQALWTVLSFPFC